MAECLDTVLLGIQSSCEALKKVGGLDLRVYVGTIDDLAAVTFTADQNAVATMTFKTGKGLVQYTGKVDKNNAATSLEVGENVNIRQQSVNIFVGIDTAIQLDTADKLIDLQKVFVIAQTRAGQLEVYGINKTNFGSFGLKVTAIIDNSGTLINDSTLFSATLSGGLTNLKLLYKPTIALDVNIAALDTLSIDPAPVP